MTLSAILSAISIAKETTKAMPIKISPIRPKNFMFATVLLGGR